MLKENELCPTALTSFDHICGHTYLSSPPHQEQLSQPGAEASTSPLNLYAQ